VPSEKKPCRSGGETVVSASEHPVGMLHQSRYLAEVVRYQLAGILVEGLAVGWGEEPREVVESGEVAVHITPFAMGKHLMDPDSRQPLRVGLYSIEYG